MLCTLANPHVLSAADVRQDLHATAQGGGPIDKGRRALERIRHDTGHPERGMVGLACLEQAQGEVFFGGIMRVGYRVGRPLLLGDPLLLEGLFPLLPRTELRSGLREDTAHGHGDFRGHQDEQDQALSPQRATTFFIAQFREMGECLGRFRALVVGVVDDEAARGEAMALQDDPHTGHEEVVPGHLAVSKHPGQGRHRRGAEARALKTGPAPGVGHQHGGDTKCQPGPLRDGHRVVWLMRAHGGVNGFNKGTPKGCRLSNNPRPLQAIGTPQAERNLWVI